MLQATMIVGLCVALGGCAKSHFRSLDHRFVQDRGVQTGAARDAGVGQSLVGAATPAPPRPARDAGVGRPIVADAGFRSLDAASEIGDGDDASPSGCTQYPTDNCPVGYWCRRAACVPFVGEGALCEGHVRYPDRCAPGLRCLIYEPNDDTPGSCRPPGCSSDAQCGGR